MWMLLAAFQQPTSPLLTDDEVAAPGRSPVQPGEQYPPRRAEQAATPVDPPPRRRGQSAEWRLSVDASVTADSNITNATDMEIVELDLGDTVIPVPLDPNSRARDGIGVGFSAGAHGRVPVADGVAVALDAEGYLLEYEGGRTDETSLLLAAGAELTDGGTTFLIQATGFERRYGGLVAMRGFGLRGRLHQRVGDGQRVSLSVDGRSFDSDYGDDFEGTEAGAYLGYDIVLSPNLSAAAGVYARGSWLGSDTYSNSEFGAYGGLSHYLSDDLAGGISAGLSRVAFDAPLAILGPEARRDWRWYGSAYLTTRRPLLIGLTPSLTYSYNRTGSSIEFYRADRHRLRFGLSRTF